MSALDYPPPAHAKARKGDRLVPGSAAFMRRQEIWHHNSLLGHARMMQMQLQAIVCSRTVTPRAKSIALRMLVDVKKLDANLRKRVK